MEKEKIKDYLKKQVWSNASSKYYEIQKVDSTLLDLPPYRYLKPYLKSKKSFLDIGCGDGAKTKEIYKLGDFKEVAGIDISEVAIDKARKNLHIGEFTVGDIDSLPYKKGKFDLVYSGFVIEHTVNPETVISEALRVTKKSGITCLICPNYGAPNRSSPCYKGSRTKKIIFGFFSDFFPSKKLDWNFVEPLSSVNSKHVMDYDTTVEPYILSLIRYIQSKGSKVEYYSSVWELDTGATLRHKIFKYLGTKGIFPFKYWGPQVFICIQK